MPPSNRSRSKKNRPVGAHDLRPNQADEPSAFAATPPDQTERFRRLLAELIAKRLLHESRRQSDPHHK